ncbi:MAG: hypothetical protein JXN59_18200 [Anaerolineae bacterium]|nr:hypothetical protein [Anaerolineae bacterium]
MRHWRVWFACLVVTGLLGALWGTVSAAESLQGDQCVIPAGEEIDSDIYVICNTLTIDGTVRGDVIGGAWSAELGPQGRVTGDIWLVGGQLMLEGRVDDDIRFAGVDLDIKPDVQLRDRSDLTTAALNVEVWEGATLPGDLNFFGYQALVLGAVGGDVNFNGSALIIGGDIAGNVAASVGSGETSPSFIPFPFPFTVSFQTPGLTVRSGGSIGGDLNYSGARPGNINGRIGGEINFTLDMPRPDITQAALETEETTTADLIGRYLRNVLTDLLALMMAGVLVGVAVPAWVREPARLVTRQTASSFGWGMILSLLAIPVTLIILIVSLLLLVIVARLTLGGFTGMGLLIALLVNTFVTGGLAFVILFVSRLVISYLIGRRLAQRFLKLDNRLFFTLLSLLIGAFIYTLVTNLPVPVVGLLLNAIGVFIGLGAIVLHARNLYQRTVRVYPPAAPGPAHLPAPAPALEALRGNAPEPPPDSGEHPAPGMGNLPDGFRWWGANRDR